jgi:hypothetical protein
MSRSKAKQLHATLLVVVLGHLPERLVDLFWLCTISRPECALRNR